MYSILEDLEAWCLFHYCSECKIGSYPSYLSHQFTPLFTSSFPPLSSHGPHGTVPVKPSALLPNRRRRRHDGRGDPLWSGCGFNGEESVAGEDSIIGYCDIIYFSNGLGYTVIR
jgi:hypothetical protein